MCLEGNVSLMAAVNGNKEDKVAKKTNGWQQKVFCKVGEWQCGSTQWHHTQMQQSTASHIHRDLTGHSHFTHFTQSMSSVECGEMFSVERT